MKKHEIKKHQSLKVMNQTSSILFHTPLMPEKPLQHVAPALGAISCWGNHETLEPTSDFLVQKTEGTSSGGLKLDCGSCYLASNFLINSNFR